MAAGLPGLSAGGLGTGAPLATIMSFNASAAPEVERQETLAAALSSPQDAPPIDGQASMPELKRFTYEGTARAFCENELKSSYQYSMKA